MAQKEHSFIPIVSHFSYRRYPLSWCCIAIIWILSLTPFFPETPLSNVAFIDKWTHFVMYGGTCSVIWFEHLRHCKKEARRPNLQALFWFAFVGMILLGGIMELLQAYCTTRSGEWLDFYADTVGVLLGNGIGWLTKITLRN